MHHADEEFRVNYKSTAYNTEESDLYIYDTSNSPIIPVLDQPIDIKEVLEARRTSSGTKQADTMVLFLGWSDTSQNHGCLCITLIFNVIFSRGLSVPHWQTLSYSVFSSRYRDIAVASPLYKLFDFVIYRQLRSCYQPMREQAAGQKHRGNLETDRGFVINNCPQ